MKTLLFALPVLLSAACARPADPPGAFTAAQMRAVVEAGNTRLGRLYEKGDADSLALQYAPQARLCPDGTDFYVGRAAIRAFMRRELPATPIRHMRTETLSVGGTREVVYETGRTYLELLLAGRPQKLQVKYCNVWARQPNGRYLLAVDIANRDQAPTPSGSQ